MIDTVLELSKLPLKQDRIGPSIVSGLIKVIIDLTDIFSATSQSLISIAAFYEQHPVLQSLVQVYENIYLNDSYKIAKRIAKSSNGIQEWKCIPEGHITYSSAILPLLQHLNQYTQINKQSDSFQSKLAEIHNSVEIKIVQTYKRKTDENTGDTLQPQTKLPELRKQIKCKKEEQVDSDIEQQKKSIFSNRTASQMVYNTETPLIFTQIENVNKSVAEQKPKVIRIPRQSIDQIVQVYSALVDRPFQSIKPKQKQKSQAKLLTNNDIINSRRSISVTTKHSQMPKRIQQVTKPMYIVNQQVESNTKVSEKAIEKVVKEQQSVNLKEQILQKKRSLHLKKADTIQTVLLKQETFQTEDNVVRQESQQDNVVRQESNQDLVVQVAQVKKQIIPSNQTLFRSATQLKMQTLTEEGLQFNCYGIFNTDRDNSIYKVTAQINNNEYVFNQINWEATKQNLFRFCQEDFVLQQSEIKFEKYTTLVYIIEKYNFETDVHEPNYAFAVQPLVQLINGELMLITGQFQLPLLEGPPPSILLQFNQNPLKIVQSMQSQGQCSNLEFKQLLSRVSAAGSKEPHAKYWWPQIQPSMHFVKHNTIHVTKGYVLHARHGKQQTSTNNLKSIFGDSFNQVVQRACNVLDL